MSSKGLIYAKLLLCVQLLPLSFAISNAIILFSASREALHDSQVKMTLIYLGTVPQSIHCLTQAVLAF